MAKWPDDSPYAFKLKHKPPTIDYEDSSPRYACVPMPGECSAE